MTNLAVNLAATGHSHRPAARVDNHVLSDANWTPRPVPSQVTCEQAIHFRGSPPV
jgi:hypothetical protein